jgi:hypothetical protein
MVGDTLVALLVAGKNDPGFVHNGALAGLVALCAGSDPSMERNTKPTPGNSRSGQAYLQVCILSCIFVQ